MNSEFKENLKAQIEMNPAWALGAAAALMMGLSKLWEAKTHAKYARVHERNVNRLVRKDRRRK